MIEGKIDKVYVIVGRCKATGKDGIVAMMNPMMGMIMPCVSDKSELMDRCLATIAHAGVMGHDNIRLVEYTNGQVLHEIHDGRMN